MDIEAFRENGKEQLREMIRQHYNHPSICLWGIFNELSMRGDSPVPYIEELDAIAHEEDPTRPTTSASNIDGELNFVTDAIAWNRYDGWYGGTPADLGKWLDRTHEEHPEELADAVPHRQLEGAFFTSFRMGQLHMEHVRLRRGAQA